MLVIEAVVDGDEERYPIFVGGEGVLYRILAFRPISLDRRWDGVRKGLDRNFGSFNIRLARRVMISLSLHSDDRRSGT